MQDALFPDGQVSAAWALTSLAEQADPVHPFAEAVLPALVRLLQSCRAAETRRAAASALTQLAFRIRPDRLPMPLASAAVHGVCQMLKVWMCSRTCRLMSSIMTFLEPSSHASELQDDPLPDNKEAAVQAMYFLAWHADLKGQIADAALLTLASLLEDSSNTALSHQALGILELLVDDNSLCGRVADAALHGLAAWLKVCELHAES